VHLLLSAREPALTFILYEVTTALRTVHGTQYMHICMYVHVHVHVHAHATCDLGHVRAARERRGVEHAAQRSIAFGVIGPARAGARLPPASSGRMAGRPVRGWVRDPIAEGRGSRDRGSTHLSDLAPIPKWPRR